MNIEQLEKLEKLSKLKQDGAISDEEFEKQKAIILKPIIIDKKGNKVEASNNNGCFMAIGIIIFIVIFFAIISEDSNKNKSYYKSSTYLTSSDSLNRAYKLSKVILKESLKNPDSYDEVLHNEYFVKKDRKRNKKKVHIQVMITYRATNSFNAIITETKYFGYDKDFILVQTND